MLNKDQASWGQVVSALLKRFHTQKRCVYTVFQSVNHTVLTNFLY